MHSKLLSGKLHKIFWESLILYWSTNIRNNSFYAVYFNHAFILYTGFGPTQQWNKSSTIRYWKYDLFTGIERAFHIFCLPEPKARVKYCPFISLLGIYIIDLEPTWLLVKESFDKDVLKFDEFQVCIDL